jgi:hypothetical protein
MAAHPPVLTSQEDDMIIITPTSSGLLLTDSTTGQTLTLPDGDLAAFVRRLAVERYASGHENGLDDGYRRAQQEREAAERRGTELRARLALN